MRIYAKNIPAKFYADQIWNDGGLGFLKRSPQQEQEEEEAQEQQH